MFAPRNHWAEIDTDDVLIGCVLTSEGDDLLIATKFGKAIRFKEADVRSMGRASRGVTGIRFSENEDEVIGLGAEAWVRVNDSFSL